MSSLIPERPKKNTNKSLVSQNKESRNYKKFEVPDFNELIQFCLRNYKDKDGNIIDIELEQFLKHTLPRALHREEFGFERGGGGWSGAIKCFIHVINKGRKKGVW